MTLTGYNFKNILLSVLLIAAFLFATFPAWQALVHAWSNSEDYSHGFFIVPISLYLIWTKKNRLSEIPINGSLWGIALVIFALFLLLFANFAEIVTLRSIALIPLVSGVIIYLWGGAIMKELLFPVTLLLFMIPIPSQIYSFFTLPLQLFVTKFAVGLASLLRVPVFTEGNIIHLPDRSLQVIKACSGMRSIVSLMALGAVFGYLTLKSNLLRLVLFLSSLPVAVLVNTFRVLLVIVAFHFFNLDLTKGSFHQTLGLLVFAMALLILFGIKGALSSWDRSPT